MENTYIRCNIWIIYLAIQLTLGIADMFNVVNDIVILSLSFSETLVQTMVIAKLIVLRYSCAFYRTIKDVESTFCENNFHSLHEEKKYMNYYHLAKKLYVVMMMFGTVTPICYHLKPLEPLLRLTVDNDTRLSLDLPYRTYLPLSIDRPELYVLIYIYQSPMVYLNAVHTASVCLLISLVLHVCGRLSILSYRIRNISHSKGLSSFDDPKEVFRGIVGYHLEIIKLMKSIDQTFGLLVLEELIATTLMLGITSYILLRCLEDAQAGVAMIMTFTVWTAAAVIVIYGYCLAGECLISESSEVHDAYYHIRWYELPDSYKLPITICMMRANKPLRLTAAKFYQFSLTNFTSILKTAMAYVSLLRTMV
nr:olfactory receptor 68 [Gregopimpla kuwanae]